MQTLQKLKGEIHLNRELADLLDILKKIAVTQFRILERKREKFADFLRAFGGFFQMIDFSKLPRYSVDSQGKLGIVIITSNEGFMGGLNARVITTALTQEHADEAKLYIIGEKGALYLRGLEREFTPLLSDMDIGVDDRQKRYQAALKLKEYIMSERHKSFIGRLILVYPSPVSFTVQKVEVVDVLSFAGLFEKKESILDEGEKVIVEEPLGNIAEYLSETWLTQKLFEAFEDSKLAEFSARAVYLEERHQAMQKRGKGLRDQYFRSRHEFIDSGMRETFAAQIIRKRIKSL